nr:hypothetical protein CFP56_07709 [Quercus suber]
MPLQATSRAAVSPRSPLKRTIVLPDLPEASPGPNAFAQQNVQMDKYRMNGNAFYQKEVQQRKITPPTEPFTALRHRGFSNPDMVLTPRTEPAVRESNVTTMSPFINAGRLDTPQLVPTGALCAEPTGRGYIEERHEQQLHLASGSKVERTPVYTYTPKTSGVEFDKQMLMQKSQSKNEVVLVEPPKSPKKSLFDKLRKPLSSISSPSTCTLTTAEPAAEHVDTPLPPKAKAILGSPTPSQGIILRSPSKRKGFFSSRSKHPEAVDVTTSWRSQKSVDPQPKDYDHQPYTGSSPSKTPQTVFSKSSLSLKNIAQPRLERHNAQRYTNSTTAKTPQTGYSDPGSQERSLEYNSHRHPGEPAMEQSFSKCYTVARSQSLKYFDHAPPPTPPAKNTPPGQKQLHQLPATIAQSSHKSEAPKSQNIHARISTGDRVSPTKYGTYGLRAAPRLVTKPSMYSMHASVVPAMTDIDDFEDIKARVDGLGLEGFSLPTENKHRQKPDTIYSPSVYADEWQDARIESGLKTPVIHATAREVPTISRRLGGSELRNENSFSTCGSFPVWYPELLSDSSRDDATTPTAAGAQSDRESESATPYHGQTHSCDHSSTNSLPRSTDSRLFALGLEGDTLVMDNASPASMKHPSAMPSPLHFLPATTYTPLVTDVGVRTVMDTPCRKDARTVNAGLGIETSHQIRSLDDVCQPNPLETAPKLESSPRRSNPDQSIYTKPSLLDETIDPVKSQPSSSLATDKLDQILTLLSTATRNGAMDAIREELRLTNVRLNDRLSAMEQHLQTSPSLAPINTITSAVNTLPRETRDSSTCRPHLIDANAVPEKKRVSTQFAKDFYKPAPSPEPVANDEPPQAMTERAGRKRSALVPSPSSSRHPLSHPAPGSCSSNATDLRCSTLEPVVGDVTAPASE